MSSSVFRRLSCVSAAACVALAALAVLATPFRSASANDASRAAVGFCYFCAASCGHTDPGDLTSECVGSCDGSAPCPGTTYCKCKYAMYCDKCG